MTFTPAMKYLEKLIRQREDTGPLAYRRDHWTRKDAPLLEWLGAVIDHSEAHSRGGAADPSNLVTACNKCYLLKSAMLPEDFRKLRPLRPVKGKYGEPEDWDGLSSLFIMRASRLRKSQLGQNSKWIQALNSK